MRKLLFIACVVVLIVTCSISIGYGWGVWAHNKINRGAILALPRDMGMFFYNHADFITEESVVPDIRKHTLNDNAEVPRHFVDLEKYHYTSPANMPHTMADAIDRYSKDSLSKYGILPWYIQEMMQKLTKAFREKNKAEILFLAADLGHYIGDAHMPLHTTLNHDGEYTGQRGIHALWEGQLPEQFGKDYSLHTPEAHYIANIDDATWKIIDSSYKLSKKLLTIDQRMRENKDEKMMFAKGRDAQIALTRYGSPIFSYEYAHIFHELLNGMVEQQMRAAIKATADFWYTAWVNAGRPDLSNLDAKYVTDRNEVFYKEDMKYWNLGKVSGFKPATEY